MHRLLTRPKSLTELAHDSIRQLIVGGELPMGAQLSEATLAAQLGISKTPVREALLRLRVDGLIDIQPQRGTFVFSLTPRQVEEICVFREIVEVNAVKLAMEASRAELVKDLQANLREMALARKSRNWRAIRQLDEAFHQTIVDHCANAYLQQAHQMVASKISALRARLPEESEQVDHCQQNHATIASLMRDGRIAPAQRALALHIRDTLASYLAASNIAAAA
ncbi:MAG TPA: GntR family transcriptional regulator [Burkholderiaceae bacterium]|nr:GntR family transcriptional regulator [Burkholderiaceae bacterium]